MTAALVVLAVPVWLFLISPFWLSARENAVPDLDRLQLPPGTTIVSVSEGSSNASAWHEVELRPADGTTEDELLERLGIVDGHEVCWNDGPPMFWTACIGRDESVRNHDKVVIYYLYDRPL